MTRKTVIILPPPSPQEAPYKLHTAHTPQSDFALRGSLHSPPSNFATMSLPFKKELELTSQIL